MAKNGIKNKSTSYIWLYFKKELKIYILIEQLLKIRENDIKIFFYFLKLYISHIIIIAIIFDLFNIQVFDFIIVATKKYYIYLYISAYIFNQFIYNLVVFIFKYLVSGLLIILFIFY